MAVSSQELCATRMSGFPSLCVCSRHVARETMQQIELEIGRLWLRAGGGGGGRRRVESQCGERGARAPAGVDNSGPSRE